MNEKQRGRFEKTYQSAFHAQMHNEDAEHWPHHRCMTSCLRSQLMKASQYWTKAELKRAGGTRGSEARKHGSTEPRRDTIDFTNHNRGKPYSQKVV